MCIHSIFIFSAIIQESGLFMDAMLNVLNSAPKITKKRKPKIETVKKSCDSCSTIPSSPPSQPSSATHLSLKTDQLLSPSRSPIHSPSTLDIDSLNLTSQSNADEPLSFTEPMIQPSDYVPLSEEMNISEDLVALSIEPTIKAVEPITEKPPQLKVSIISVGY